MEERFVVREASTIGHGIRRLVVEAPRVAARAHPGQFVIVRVTDDGERIPLTVCEWDDVGGTITLVVQAVGRTTLDLGALRAGDKLSDVLGPLGHPTTVDGLGRCVVVSGGVGTAIALPVAAAMTASRQDVTAIVGFRTRDHAILIDEMAAATGRIVVMTEDGTLGDRGLVTDALHPLLDRGGVDHVFTVGPIPMMAAVAEATRRSGVPTVASLNPIMVDGTGMCGGCRVRIGGETRFACVDGPEFDAHEVDFELLSIRNAAYGDFELCQAEVPARG